MNYSKYTLSDFLADEEFKKWVLKSNTQDDQFWSSWVKANPEKKELIMEAKEIIMSVKFKQPDIDSHRYDNALQFILQSDIRPKEKNIYHFQLFSNLTKIAAAITIILTFAVTKNYFIDSQKPVETVIASVVTKSNPSGQKSTFILPDGTKVVLNAESVLSFPQVFDESSREVTLSGEAFFEVTKDNERPFTVHSGPLSTTALGTSFNIRNFQNEDYINVSLSEGKVRISQRVDSTVHSLVLTPGEQISCKISSGELIKDKFNSEKVLGWKDGLLVFNDVDLDEFIQELERWYGVEFEVTGTKTEQWHIEGRFDNESLEEILDGLTFAYDVEYEIKNNIVKLNL